MTLEIDPQTFINEAINEKLDRIFKEKRTDKEIVCLVDKIKVWGTGSEWLNFKLRGKINIFLVKDRFHFKLNWFQRILRKIKRSKIKVKRNK